MVRSGSSALLAMLMPFAVLVTACADRPVLEPAAAGPDYAAGPSGGYPVVIVRPSGGPAREPGVPVVNDLAEAVAAVREGGTIRVHPGTYAADGIVVDKAVTIVGTGGRPLVRTDGVAAFFLRHPSGVTEVRGIDFEGSSYGNLVAQVFDQVRIEDCGFSGAGTAGVVAGPTETVGSRLVVESSSFSGQLVGVFAPDAQVVEVLGSSFRDHTFSSIHFQWGSAGRIEGNEIDGCGSVSCIATFQAPAADIVGNRITNARPSPTSGAIRVSGPIGAGGAFVIADNEIAGAGEVYHDGISVERGTALIRSNLIAGANRGITMAGGSSGTLEGNVVEPCGASACISLGGAGAVTVRGNTLRSVASIGTIWGIISHTPADGGPVTITSNLIEGVDAPANPHDPSTYPLQLAYQVDSWGPGNPLDGLPLGAPTTFSGNTIRNAGAGVAAFHGGVVEGRDNTFETIHGVVLSAHDRGINRLRFNDILGYSGALGRSDDGGGGPDFNGVLEVTCNWWGDASGPQGVGDVPTAAYTPWATSPITGTGATSCSGGL